MSGEDEVPEPKDPPSSSANCEYRTAKLKDNAAEVETDDFGLPRKSFGAARAQTPDVNSDEEDGDTFHDAQDDSHASPDGNASEKEKESEAQAGPERVSGESPNMVAPVNGDSQSMPSFTPSQKNGEGPTARVMDNGDSTTAVHVTEEAQASTEPVKISTTSNPEPPSTTNDPQSPVSPLANEKHSVSPKIRRERSAAGPTVSEWSHQRLAPQAEAEQESEEEEEWKAMPALGEYDIYDDENRLVARAAPVETEETAAYQGLGGAAKGYTRIQLDEDAQSATSMDEDTGYLFKEGQKNAVVDDDEQRDAMSQLQATKDLLTEGQRIAYVGVARLTIYNMARELEGVDASKITKKLFGKALESMEKWGQQIMVRLYGHMEIDSAEQLMIEQLAAHDLQPADLVPQLMQNARVKNPMADETLTSQSTSASPEDSSQSIKKDGVAVEATSTPEASPHPPPYKSPEGEPGPEVAPSKVVEDLKTTEASEAPPAYDLNDKEHVPDIQSPLDVPHTAKIDIDLRWTVLCDLFLMLISDSSYDARSRLLLERVASAMQISWVQVCRFEKRVTDALEMQEEADKETWNEADHMEKRRKMGLRRKYMFMGLATVGGGLVIGLSAGLLAPVIGAGLAAGFTTIGVTGTAGFLGGVGGAALITSAAATTGGVVAVRASHRRTGAVTTFEYRPLHNNKRVNLILTVSGWMNGKVDDVRLPYSTVDPIMGDIYSLLWEPEMLQSMGETINILATEALTQTVQQVLGSTILTALMASIQLPIVLTKLSYLIDNPWSVSLDRATSAGQILADSLIDRHLGQRPITLLGFSLGSRVIFSCLRELAARCAHGLVQNVYLFGSPIVAKREEYLRARSVISGRFVNGYASNDWILGYLFRATSGGIMRVAGLAPVEDIPGLENIDVTALVKGHMAYRAAMPKLLREVGWEVESDEFTEIEDPDPDNHDKRQRELIREIDEARKEAETKPEKRRFGFFKRGKLAEKKGWETYDPSSMKPGHTRGDSESSLGGGGILFDIDAIRRELESEMIEVRELDSTLPPMQISTKPNGGPVSSGRPSIEAVLAHQGLDAEEIAKIKLPPRPDEIDDHHRSSTNGKKVEEPKMSLDADFDFPAPKELKSTLPPLKLSPSLPQNFGNTTPSLAPPFRPELKTHSTTPNLSSTTTGERVAVLQPSFTALNLEHNAWADEDEDFGNEKEIRMSFE